MKKYRVIEGSHFEGDVEFTKGNILVGPDDLPTRFPRKFECLGEVEPEPARTEQKAEEAVVATAKPSKKKIKEEEWE